MLSCCELLNRQPVVRQVPVPCCYLCWSVAVPRASLPRFSFPNRILQPLPVARIVSYSSLSLLEKKKKPVTKASCPFHCHCAAETRRSSKVVQLNTLQRGSAVAQSGCCCGVPLTSCYLLCVSPSWGQGKEQGDTFCVVVRPVLHSQS